MLALKIVSIVLLSITAYSTGVALTYAIANRLKYDDKDGTTEFVSCIWPITLGPMLGIYFARRLLGRLEDPAIPVAKIK